MSLRHPNSFHELFNAIFGATLAVAALSGCASTLPMEGGLVDDHATTLEKCGVGNYAFLSSRSGCSAKAAALKNEAPEKSEAKATMKESPKEAEKVSAPETKDSGKPVAKLVENKIEISKPVNFRTGSAVLTPSGMAVLDGVITVMNANVERILKLKIEGHTDAVGNLEKNMSLSTARAESVKDYLTKKGIDPAKLEAKGYGPTRPKFDPATATKAQLAQNRRVEFVVETL